MDLTVLTFEELKTLADSIEGFKYHPNSKEETLRKNLGEYLEEHPEAIADPGDDQNNTPGDETKGNDGAATGDTPAAPTEPAKAATTPGDETKAPEGLVKIKADDLRGVVASSVGKVDFGIDGIAEVAPEVAEHFCDKIPKGFNRC